MFPYDPAGLEGRIDFGGVETDKEVRDHYVGKRVPAELLPKGAQRSFRYLEPSADGGESHEDDDND